MRLFFFLCLLSLAMVDVRYGRAQEEDEPTSTDDEKAQAEQAAPPAEEPAAPAEAEASPTPEPAKEEAPAAPAEEPAAPAEAEAPPTPEPAKEEEPAPAEQAPTPTPEAEKKEAPSPTPTPPAAPAEEEEVIGIDTIDIDEPQGNWLFKRVWWERAQGKYEKIQELVEAVMESRMSFFEKRTKLDREVFDPFYTNAGLSRGQLQEMLQRIKAKLDQEQQEDIVLSEEEREVLATLEAEKKNLEQLEADVKTIQAADEAVDDTITVLIQQINQTRSYEREAWKNFKGIAQELSDKKARELYQSMDTFYSNIKEVRTYISDALTQHLEQLSTLAKERIEKVQTALKASKEKGVDLINQLQKLDELERAEEKELMRKEIEESVSKKEEKKVSGVMWRTIDSLWQTTKSFSELMFTSVKKIWDVTLGRFFGASKQEQPAIPEVPPAPEPVSAEAPPVPGPAPEPDKTESVEVAPVAPEPQQPLSAEAPPVPGPVTEPGKAESVEVAPVAPEPQQPLLIE